MTDKIIGISQKTAGGSYTPQIPFGAIGENIDMFNGNDLEEEFKLGGPCITSFNSDESGTTIITEEFKTGEQSSNYYKVITEIKSGEEGNITITQKLFMVESAGVETLIKSKVITFESQEGDTTIKEEMS